jgi:Cu-Zn family superoxide dismutase
MISGVFAVACAAAGKPPRPPMELERFGKGEISAPVAAVIQPGPESNVKGTVTFTADSDGVRVVGRLEGFEPNTVHGFHVHDFGDCSDPTFKSAGDHFNPQGKPHGSPDSENHHAGDFGNITAGPDGVASFERLIKGIEAPNVFVGRAVIVHQKADDLHSQPAGDAGARIGCGVIGFARH